MKNLKSEDLIKLSDADLTKRLNELRTDLSKLRSAAARGTLKKELGEVKTVRRNIARVLTVESSRRKDNSRQSTSGMQTSSKTDAVEVKPEGGKETKG